MLGNWNRLVKKKKKEEERKNDFKKFAYLSSMKKRMKKKNTQVDDAIDTFERLFLESRSIFKRMVSLFLFVFSLFF